MIDLHAPPPRRAMLAVITSYDALHRALRDRREELNISDGDAMLTEKMHSAKRQTESAG